MEIGGNIGCAFIGVAIIAFVIMPMVDWLFIPEIIESEVLITPEIELIIEDNEVDTIYIYKLP